MGRTAVKDKLPNVKARPVWKWKVDLLKIAQTKGPRIHVIMSNLLFGKEKAEEADLVYRHLLLEYGNNDIAAFRILLACATAIDKDEQAFPFSHKEAQAALNDIEAGHPTKSAAVEFYRPLAGETIWGEIFEMPNDANDPWKPHPFMISELKRYASPAGQRGRTRRPSDAQTSFIVVMRILLRDKRGKVLKSLFDRLYKFTFGKTIHLPDYRDTIRWAEEGLAARLPGEKDTPPPEK